MSVDSPVSGMSPGRTLRDFPIADLGSHLAPRGCEAVFPEARTLQYSPERRRAYLPCSGWVRECPRRCGRLEAGSRNRTATRYQPPVVAVCTCDPVNARTRFIGRSDMIGGFGRLVLAG